MYPTQSSSSSLFTCFLTALHAGSVRPRARAEAPARQSRAECSDPSGRGRRSRPCGAPQAQVPLTRGKIGRSAWAGRSRATSSSEIRRSACRARTGGSRPSPPPAHPKRGEERAEKRPRSEIEQGA
eukprot:2837973-Pleurochrysis_carterae.AAC.1